MSSDAGKKGSGKEVIASKGGGSEVGFLDNPSLDFNGLQAKMIELINAQAMVDVKDISLSEIELTKAKADNYLQALNNMLEIADRFELIQAQAKKFKRTDELDMLNTLRETVHLAGQIGQRNMKQAARVQDAILSNIDEDGLGGGVGVEALSGVEEILEQNVGRVSKLTATAAELIKLERESGGRPMGQNRSKVPTINYMMKLEEKAKEAKQEREYGVGVGGGGGAGKNSAPRAMTEEEMMQLGLVGGEIVGADEGEASEDEIAQANSSDSLDSVLE